MKFGPVPVTGAEGAVLAHSVQVGDTRLRKGVILTPDHLSQLAAAGHGSVIVARLEPGDCHEDEAARKLAAALVPDPDAAALKITQPFTGRVNLLADGPGVAILDVASLQAFNQVNPMITIATVPQYQQMGAGGMVATVKVISYAVPGEDVARASQLARNAIRLARPVHRTAGLIVTDIPGGPPNEKGIASIRGRVEALGMGLCDVQTVAHRTQALASAIRHIGGDVVMILTGSATSDV